MYRSPLAPLLSKIYLAALDRVVDLKVQSFLPNSVIIKGYVDDFFLFVYLKDLVCSAGYMSFIKSKPLSLTSPVKYAQLSMLSFWI